MVTRSHRTIHKLIVTALVGAIATMYPLSAAAEPTIETLENELAETTAELDVIVEDYNQVNDELGEVEQRYDDLLSTTEHLRDQTQAAAEEVGRIAEALYRTAGVTPLLSSTPDTLADRLSVLDYLGGDRQQWLIRLDETSTALQDEQLALDQLNGRLDALAGAKSDKETEITEAMAQLDRAQAAAVNAGYEFNPNLPPPPVPGGDAGAAGTAVGFVHNALGAPYQWGGTGPGYDCSGLTSAAWGSAGVHLPHSSQGQYDSVARIGREQLQPGDLVFYYDDLRHVAMYVGEGKIIHAPSAGQSVQVAPVDQMPVYGYGRPG